MSPKSDLIAFLRQSRHLLAGTGVATDLHLPNQSVTLLRRLEPRIMYDAAALTTALDAADQPADVTLSSGDAAPADNGAVVDAGAPFGSLAATTDGPQLLFSAAGDEPGRAVVFIDSGVRDPAALIAAAGEDAEIVLLDPRQDGFTQIADYLDGRSGLASIHIVSHGEAGEVTLAGQDFRNGDLVTHASDLARIGSALSEDGDILLYGCSVGAGASGQAFIQVLSDLTGADVAASTDDTGAAANGGDFDLETRIGFIEATPIDAPEMHGVLAPLNITVSSAPATNGLTGNGAVALWENAGFIGSTAIDIRATVVAASPGAAIQFATAYGDDFYGLGRDADDMWLQVTGGTATVKWEIFAAGTNQAIIAVGDPSFRIADIDGDGSVNTAFPTLEVESVAPDVNGLTGYVVDNPSNLLVGVSGGKLHVVGTTSQNAEPSSLVAFNWTSVSSWQVTYSAQPGWGTRFFFHDGDGDFAFVNPATSYMLGVDLDANNSTATGTAYQATFSENGAAVPVVDADIDITQHVVLGGNLDSALVTLTNAMAGDLLAVDTATLASLGISASVDTSVGGVITVSLSGTASVANYESALKAISFSNSSEAPNTTDRVITVAVTNALFATTSNIAQATIHVAATNDLPVAENNTGATGEDSVLSVVASGVLANDSDLDGDPLTVASAQNSAGNPIAIGSAVTLPSGAKLTLDADGSYVFDPNGVYNGLDTGETATESFTYTVSDGHGGSDTATVTITINGANDAPLAGAIAGVAKTDGQTFSINAGAVFSDPDVEPLTFSATGLPAWLSIDPLTGIISGSAPADASQGGAAGVYTITVIASDGTTTTAQSFHLTIGNPPPVAVDNVASTNENSAVTVSTSLLVNDHDTAPDSDTLGLVSATNSAGGAIAIGSEVTLPSGAKLTLNADGTYTYKPNGAFEGLDDGETATDTFSYVVSDGQGGSDTAIVTITIDGRNDTPTAGVLPARSGMDGDTVSLDLGALFSDRDGEPLSYLVSGLPDGLTYDPATGVVSGNIDFSTSQNGLVPAPGGSRYVVTVVASDGDAEITRTFNYTVTNPAPVALDDTAAANEDGPAVSGNVLADNGLGADRDGGVDGDQLTVVGVGAASGGVGGPLAGSSGGTFMIGADGAFTFDPAGDFEDLAVGETRTTTIAYTISDGNGGTDTATLTITITGSNDTPVAIDDSGDVGEDATTSANVLANDSDPDTTDTLTLAAALDSAGQPIALATPATLPSGAILTVNPDGTYAYDPNGVFAYLDDGETATDTFSYQVSDGHGGTAWAAVTITITGSNDAPVAAPIASIATVDGSGVLVPAGAAFSDVDGEPLAFSATGLPAGLAIDPLTGTISGTLAASASQGGPAGDGVYLVTITASDGTASVEQTLEIAVTNPPPVAIDDAVSASEDGHINGSVLADNGGAADHDTAPDSDTLTVVEINGNPVLVGGVVAGSSGGEFTINGDGSFGFAAAGDFEGLAVGETATTSITYRVSDGNGGTDEATITVTVIGSNDTPVVVDPAHPGQPGDPATVLPAATATDGETITPIDAAAVFADPDASDILEYSAAGLPAGLMIDPVSGAITGTLAFDASVGGPDSDGVYPITVTATDPYGAATTVTFTYTVTNPAPTALDDVLGASEDGPGVIGNVIAGIGSAADSDGAPDDDVLGVAAINGDPALVGQPVGGSLGGVFVIGSTGALTFDPAGDFEDLAVGETRVTTISYTVADGQGGSDIATVSVTVTGVNDGPLVIDPANPGTPPADPDAIVPVQVVDDGEAIEPLDLAIYFADPDATDVLTYAVDPAELPPGLALDPLTGVISGTLDPSASQGGPDGDGRYPITVTAEDPHGATVTTTIIYQVGNPLPVALDDTLAANEDGPGIVGNVLADNGAGADHDTAPDSDPLTVAAINGDPALVGQPVAGSAGGTFTVNPAGTFVFDPAGDFEDLAVGESRVTTVSYLVSDGNGGTDIAVVSVTVAGANDAPVVVDPNDPANPMPDPGSVVDAQAGTDGLPVKPLDVSGVFADPDGGAVLTFTATGLPPGLSIDPATGVITGTIPNWASPAGPFHVVVTATDEHGESAEVRFDWSVANPPPAAEDTSRGTDENKPIIGSLSGHVSDPDGDPLTFVLAQQPMHGTLELRPDGSFVYTPVFGFHGTDVFVYEVRDPDGGSSFARVDITVKEVADQNISQIDLGGGRQPGVGVPGYPLLAELLTPTTADHGAIEVTYPNNVYIHFVVNDAVIKIETQYGLGAGGESARYMIRFVADQSSDARLISDEDGEPLFENGIVGDGGDDIEEAFDWVASVEHPAITATAESPANTAAAVAGLRFSDQLAATGGRFALASEQ